MKQGRKPCLCVYELLDATQAWLRNNRFGDCPRHQPPETLGRMIRPGLDNEHDDRSPAAPRHDATPRFNRQSWEGKSAGAGRPLIHGPGGPSGCTATDSAGNDPISLGLPGPSYEVSHE